jgi:hypothetical protein
MYLQHHVEQALQGTGTTQSMPPALFMVSLLPTDHHL